MITARFSARVRNGAFTRARVAGDDEPVIAGQSPATKYTQSPLSWMAIR